MEGVFHNSYLTGYSISLCTFGFDGDTISGRFCGKLTREGKMIQALLPIFPKETTRINDILAFQKKDNQVYYFNATMPIFSHAEDDIASFYMIASQLYINGNCKQVEIVKAFGVTSISVKRGVKKYREEGLAGFFTKLVRQNKPRVLTPEVIENAQKLFNDGKSRTEITEELSIKPYVHK